jgi:hypothetical protein
VALIDIKSGDEICALAEEPTAHDAALQSARSGAQGKDPITDNHAQPREAQAEPQPSISLI